MPGYRHRLNRTQQRIYDRSDAVASIRLRVTPRLRQAVAAVPALLATGAAERVERAAQGDREGHVVERALGRELLQEPQPALVGGDRPVDPGVRSARDGRRAAWR